MQGRVYACPASSFGSCIDPDQDPVAREPVTHGTTNRGRSRTASVAPRLSCAVPYSSLGRGTDPAHAGCWRSRRAAPAQHHGYACSVASHLPNSKLGKEFSQEHSLERELFPCKEIICGLGWLKWRVSPHGEDLLSAVCRGKIHQGSARCCMNMGCPASEGT